MTNLSAAIIRFRYLIIIVVCGITLFFAFFLKDMRVNPDVFSYLPKQDKVANLFSRVGEKYGGNYTAMIAMETGNVFSAEALRHIRTITDSLRFLPGTGHVMSLTNIIDIKGSEWGIEIGNLIDPYDLPEGPEELQALRDYVLSQEMYQGTMVSVDATVTLILFKIQEGVDKIALATKVKKMVEGMDLKETFYYGGLPFLMLDIQEIILKDIRFLAPLCLVIIAMVLFWGFRNKKGVILPILVVFISIIWTMGLMAVLKIEITIISNIIPIVLIAVGSAYTIHVMNRITESAAKDPLVAIKTGLAYVIIPVFLAALTTMAGFLSFIAGSYLRMIQFFGVFTAMGVLFALLLSVTFIPALMAVSSKKRIDGNHTAESRSRWLNGFLDWIRKSVTSHRRTVLLTWMLLITAGIVGACLVERKVDFLDYFRKDSPTRVTEKVMREKLTGTYPVYILVEGNVQDPYVLNTMRETATFLEKFPEIRHTQSVADLIERMNDVMGEGMTIPDDEAKIQQLWFLLEGQDIMEQLVSFDLQEGLITANYSSTDTRLISRFVDDAAQYLAVHSSDRCRMSLTGSPSLFMRMDESLLSSQMQSLLYAIGLVVVVISILLKSIKKGLIATVPILVTLVILFGFMGFTGIPLDIATVLVGSISIGIGIDYSIHMIVHVNHELRNSLPMGEAIAHSVRISGRSITLNVLSVTAGFLVLMLSNLMPLQRFGLLVAVTMIASGLAALTLLPVLLVSTSRSKKDNK